MTYVDAREAARRAEMTDDEGIDIDQVEMEELRRRDWLDRLLDGDHDVRR